VLFSVRAERFEDLVAVVDPAAGQVPGPDEKGGIILSCEQIALGVKRTSLRQRNPAHEVASSDLLKQVCFTFPQVLPYRCELVVVNKNHRVERVLGQPTKQVLIKQPQVEAV